MRKNCDCGTWPSQVAKFPSLDTLLTPEEFAEYLVEVPSKEPQYFESGEEDIDSITRTNWLFFLAHSVSFRSHINCYNIKQTYSFPI